MRTLNYTNFHDGNKKNVIGCPSERVMVIAQIQNQSIGSVIKKNGFRGLYCGFWSTLSRDIVFNMAFFTSREFIIKHYEKWQKRPPCAWTRVLLGLPAAGVACTISCPLDVVKTRVQGSGLGERSM